MVIPWLEPGWVVVVIFASVLFLAMNHILVEELIPLLMKYH